MKMSRAARVRASRPAAPTLEFCMPWNGMDWGSGRSHITRHGRIDVAVVNALRSLGVPIQKRDVQVEFINLVEKATAFSRGVASTPGEDFERSKFLAEFREETRLGRRLSPGHFEQLFTAIVLARYRYLENRYLEDLPVESPATHCHLAQAVDAFEKAAWFWSSVEAFLEDDQERGDDIEGQSTLPSDLGKNNQNLPATSLSVGTMSLAAAAAGDGNSKK